REREAAAAAQHPGGLGDRVAGVRHELECAARAAHDVEAVGGEREPRRALNTTVKLSSANGSAVAVPSTAGTATPVSSSMRRECWSWRNDRSMPTPRPPWPHTQREHWPAHDA